MRSIMLGLVLILPILSSGSLVVACSSVETAPGHASRSLDGGQDADVDADADAGDGSFPFPRCQYCDLVYGCVDSGPDAYTETCDGGQMCGQHGKQVPYYCCTPQVPNDGDDSCH